MSVSFGTILRFIFIIWGFYPSPYVKPTAYTISGDFESEKRTVQNEITIHRRLSHPNIVKYFTTKQIDNIFLIFMEYVEGESLFDRVERGGPLNSNVVIDFTYQILSGLVYMHSQEIVHRLVCVFSDF